jgi:hypothetical protein
MTHTSRHQALIFGGVDVASNGERFTLANAANLKTYYWKHGISGRLEI